MGAIIVILATTLFGYGITWLLEREPLTTADLALVAPTGFAWVLLARALAGNSLEIGLLFGCGLALTLQRLRRSRATFERVR